MIQWCKKRGNGCCGMQRDDVAGSKRGADGLEESVELIDRFVKRCRYT